MVEEELKLVNEKILEDFLVWRLNFFKGIYEYNMDLEVIDVLTETKEEFNAMLAANTAYADEMKLCIEVIEKFISKRSVTKNVCENFSNQTSEILQK